MDINKFLDEIEKRNITSTLFFIFAIIFGFIAILCITFQEEVKNGSVIGISIILCAFFSFLSYMMKK